MNNQNNVFSNGQQTLFKAQQRSLQSGFPGFKSGVKSSMNISQEPIKKQPKYPEISRSKLVTSNDGVKNSSRQKQK